MADGDIPRAAELATQLGYPSTADQVALRFAALRERSTEAVLVAADAGDRVIGWIHVGRVFSLAVSESALIGGLVVDEAHRSERVGAELLAAAEAWARDHGVRTMTVSSRVTREGAHRFYLREGYELSKTSHVFAKPLV
jgi:GNAT superfamily N-acetyltransferase